ncbi:hypothetical protein CQW23_11464 [Capsicum baccatum]|uniref:RBR-type E3 ubiquitin transferase n=1 Tax=Capsicum baccatum TaxID=33114 RepID=A0A2G2WPU0_CAPBA|nr:hypothetical protein CQW23_11464 [Capsicum baccatum]
MANLDSVDEFYFSVLFDHEEPLFPISDEMYAEEFQLQEALMSAATISVFNKCKKVKREHGESSGTFCSICTNNKLANEMFVTGNCSHCFCIGCIAKYVTKRIVLENVTVIKCPDTACNAVIKPKLWRELVPKEVLDKWENAMSESIVLGSRKLYCPYKDCSAMLVVDGSDTVIDTERPDCRRLFCARCNVPWHVGLECKEFQHSGGSNERGKGGAMMTGTAKNKKWRRCSKCKCYVEKVDDCLHLTCRCGYEFCY